MIFEVTTTHIEALNDTDLRTLVGYLAEREVVDAGRSAVAVTYGGHQNAKDDGIDVRVSLASGTIEGYVPRIATGYQVKAEDFSVAKIKKEMRPEGKLRESIRELSEAGGAYLIVSSKGSVSDLSLKKRKKAMAEAIADEPTAKLLFLDFYDKRRIATWVNQHPGIIPWVRDRVGQPLSGWRPFQDWSSSPEAEDGQYVLDDGVRLSSANQNDNVLKAEEGINRLRSILNERKGVVRLVGLSGVGKTRLVQALFDSRIGVLPLDRHLAVYTDIGDNPDPVPLELVSRIQSNGQRCILIVDNCGAELHRKLVARLSVDSPISLITIEYDISDDEPEKTDVFKLEPASKDVIEKILTPRYPKLTGQEIRTITDFSEGNFRIALALANTSKDGQSLANLKDTDLFNRLFRQKNEDNPALLRAAKICSLVYSFDAETMEGDKAELPLLAALAGQSVSEFHGHVAELKRRQLIQARARWRALLPHALSHRFAKLALEDLPGANLKTFTDTAPERLLKSFSRRLGCLHDSAPAQKIVGDWLATDGKISKVEHLTPLGMVILDNVAPVNPEAVLEAINAAVATNPGLLDNHLNANAFVRLLRSLAYEPALFDKATGLIARFARLKTETNNTSPVNVFKSLFHVRLSGTHAPPKQRAEFLRKLAVEGGEPDQALVMTALGAMLNCGHFSSSYGFDFGTRIRNYGFYPGTYGEQWDWYAVGFSLADSLEKISAMRSRVRSMIAAKFSDLAPHVRIDDLIALAENFVKDGGWPEGWAGVRVAIRKAKKANKDEIVRKLTDLESKVMPRSLSHRIASYVLPDQWGALDLADIDFTDDEKYEKALKKIEEVSEEIGAELADDVEALRHHLPDLLTSKSQRVFSVAKAIGKKASNPTQVWRIIEDAVLAPEHDGIIYTFPGGFLSGLVEKSREYTDKLLNAALANTGWYPYLPHMHLCIGIDKIGIKRLISAISSPALPTSSLRNLAAGRSTDNLDAVDFESLLMAIAAKEDGLDVAIEILFMRIHSLKSDKKPISGVERDAARALLPNITFNNNNKRENHMLRDIVRDCLLSPEDTHIAKRMCEQLLDAVGEWRVSPWDYSDVVAELAGIFPRVILEEALETGENDNQKVRGLFENLRENHLCPLRKIADEDLLAWAHEKPDTRFPALAASVRGWQGPKKPAQNSDDAQDDDDQVTGLRWTTAALRLIHEAPDPVAVLQEFAENFRPSGWSGSLADILAAREALLVALADDPDQRVQDWAKATLPKLRDEVEKTRKWEAAHDRERDERFDW